MDKPQSKPRTPGFFLALTPLLMTVILLGFSVVTWRVNLNPGLLLGTVVAAVVALSLGYTWQEVDQMIKAGVQSVVGVVLVFILVGSIIGLWIASGTVPTMIYYGLSLISPKVFLPIVFLLTSVVSMVLGTSLGTVTTVGVALIGIGRGLNIPLPLVAGAVVSGAYFGDRSSPLSGSANLTAAVTETDLNDNLRYMLATITPAYVLTLLLYTIIGLRAGQGGTTGGEVAAIQRAITSAFQVHPALLLPPVLIILLAFRQMPTLPNLALGATVSGVLGLLFQGAHPLQLFTAAYSGVTTSTGHPVVDKLLTGGGMTSMTTIILMMILVGAFGGILENSGMLKVLIDRLFSRVKHPLGLVLSAMAASVSLAILVCNQTIAIIIPGRMLAPLFKERGVEVKNLARAIADSGVLLSPLIPWNLNGLVTAATLGVPVMTYFPFAFLCYITPLINLLITSGGKMPASAKNHPI